VLSAALITLAPRIMSVSVSVWREGKGMEMVGYPEDDTLNVKHTPR